MADDLHDIIRLFPDFVARTSFSPSSEPCVPLDDAALVMKIMAVRSCDERTARGLFLDAVESVGGGLVPQTHHRGYAAGDLSLHAEDVSQFYVVPREVVA
jgi:hypothetical protein